MGASRAIEAPPESFRGRVRFEHEQDFGDDLTAQVRLGWDSDSNFLPQWFNNEYQNGLPINETVYVKRQHGSELASVLVEDQPNRVVTTADAEQSNREVNHLPELRYDRAGDSLLGDQLTTFTDTSADAVQFSRSSLPLFVIKGNVDAGSQGFFRNQQPAPSAIPGLPNIAYTGDPGNTTFRGDARQEVDYPLHLGVINIVPYAVGRYTVYNEGVVPPSLPPKSTASAVEQFDTKNVPATVRTTSGENRILGGVGVRATTDIWRVDDAVESDLFDLHRVRHVISPEATAWVSGQTVDQDRVLIYDPSVDALNDVQALQLALRQRWQTKRGGPGRWRSVDFLSLDVYTNLFANQPDARLRDPVGFRSVFLQAEPEYSAPRNTANVDATWRISDTTAVLSSVVHNLDREKLATANIGVAVTRDERLTYFIGTRYISELNSNQATFEASYKLDRKYSVNGSESIDLAQNRNVYYNAQIIRQFDNFSASVNVSYDQSTNQSRFGFSVSPNGLARGLGSSELNLQPH